MSTPTVFLSAASIDLKEWRDVLHDAFSRGGFRVLTQDHSLSSAPADVKRLLTETIDESDCVIHLAGLGYGSDATDPFPSAPAFQCSWTQFEYYQAHQQKKDVIAFVCAPSLSKSGFAEKGTDADDIARKQRLQREHRQRVDHGTFENTPVTALRTSNERIDSVPTLLTAVAAAVGTLHKLDREACARAQQELNQLAHALAEVKQEVVNTKDEVLKTRRFGIKAVALIVLLLALVLGGVWVVKRGMDHVAVGQTVTTARIRAHLLEASEKQLKTDLAAADQEPKSADRQRQRESANAAHQARLARMDELAASFQEIEGSAEASADMREMIRILNEEGVEAALRFAENLSARLLASVAASAQAQHEKARQKLQPLLKAAQLQQSSGQPDRARHGYEQLLKLEPDWPEALKAFAWFLRDQSIYAQSYRPLAGSLADAQQSHQLAQRLLDQDPDNRDAQRLLSASLNQLGDLAVVQGDLAGALRCFTECHAILERLAASAPANAEWQRDLSVSLNQLGDLAVAQGDLAGALRCFTQSKTIRERLAASDPANAEWQRDLSTSLSRLGDIAEAQGDLAGALRSFTGSKTIFERLAASDPANAAWQRDLSVSLVKLGDLAVAQGDLAGAMRYFTEAKTIRERLAASDPANAQWQHDLCASWSSMGNIAVAKGDLVAASEACTKFRDIIERLAASDPANATWQRDLFLSLNQLGELAVAQRDLARALRYFTGAKAIAERLAASDPTNAQWQRDLAVSHFKLAELANGNNDENMADAELHACYKVLHGMKQRGLHFDPQMVQVYEELHSKFMK